MKLLQRKQKRAFKPLKTGALLGLAVLLVSNLPDLWRYVRMERM